jgi:hypothetical protein
MGPKRAIVEVYWDDRLRICPVCEVAFLPLPNNADKQILCGRKECRMRTQNPAPLGSRAGNIKVKVELTGPTLRALVLGIRELPPPSVDSPRRENAWERGVRILTEAWDEVNPRKRK